MNREQYENVERFKAQFNLAKTGFVRVSRGDLDIIRRTYNEVYGKSLQPGNMNCNSCVLKMMKAMGDAVEKYEASQTPEDVMIAEEDEIKSEMKDEPVEEESPVEEEASPVESDGFKVEAEASPENQEEPKAEEPSRAQMAEPSRAQILAAKLKEKNEAKKKRGRPKKNS